MSDTPKSSRRFWIVALGAFSILATIQIVLLTIQNRRLKAALSPAAAVSISLKPGDKVDSFKAAAVSDQEYAVAYGDKDHLLFILSTECSWCEKNLSNWKALAEKSKGKSLRVVGISVNPLAETKAYAGKHGLNFDVLVAPPEIISGYKIGSFPQTVLVKRGGGVEKVWQGLLSEKALADISRSIRDDCAAPPCVASAH